MTRSSDVPVEISVVAGSVAVDDVAAGSCVAVAGVDVVAVLWCVVAGPCVVGSSAFDSRLPPGGMTLRSAAGGELPPPSPGCYWTLLAPAITNAGFVPVLRTW